MVDAANLWNRGDVIYQVWKPENLFCMESFLGLSLFQTMVFYLRDVNPSVVAKMGSRVVVHLWSLVVDWIIVIVSTFLIVLLASCNVVLDIPENVWEIILVLLIKLIFAFIFHILLLSFLPELSFDPVVSLLKFYTVLVRHSGLIDRWEFAECVFVDHLELSFL